MKLPVTFIRTDVISVIQNWLNSEEYQLVAQIVNDSRDMSSHFHFAKDMWYGILHDIYIEVSPCNDVIGG